MCFAAAKFHARSLKRSVTAASSAPGFDRDLPDTHNQSKRERPGGWEKVDGMVGSTMVSRLVVRPTLGSWRCCS